jgi:hypothetical protein
MHTVRNRETGGFDVRAEECVDGEEAVTVAKTLALPVAYDNDELDRNREAIARAMAEGAVAITFLEAELKPDESEPAVGTSAQPPTFRETILHEAAQITSCDRNRTYGPPRDNHSRTAAMWSAYLGITLTYRDVCLMNVLQKISRDRHCPHRDALVDSAGYLRNIEMADNDEGR